MVKQTLEEFKQIDVLVNNAIWMTEGLFIEQNRDIWQKEVDVCFWGVINCTKAVLPHMVERKYGKIVNMGSDAARMGEYKEAVYAGTKGAVISFSKSLARELGRYGVNINVICPGFTPPISVEETSVDSCWSGVPYYLNPETWEKAAKLYPLRRVGKAEDFVGPVLLLASDVSSWITGQTLSVDGGYTMI